MILRTAARTFLIIMSEALIKCHLADIYPKDFLLGSILGLVLTLAFYAPVLICICCLALAVEAQDRQSASASLADLIILIFKYEGLDFIQLVHK